MHEVFSDYQTLINLLESQQQAVETDHGQKCSALLPLVAKYRRRIESHRERVRSCSPAERARLDPLVRTLSRQIETCRREWELRRERLDGQLRQNRSTRQLVRNLERSKQQSVRKNWTI